MKFYVFLSLLFLPNCLSAQEERRDSIPPYVYNNAETIPLYPGGQQAMQRFIEKHFVFPSEAWKDTSYTKPSYGLCIIRRDGVLCDIKVAKAHPAVEKELRRVFLLMPNWEPAMIKGKPVDVQRTIQFSLYDWTTGQPFNVVKMMQKSKKYLGEKVYSDGLGKDDASTAIDNLTRIADYTADNIVVTTVLSRLQAAKGDYDEAIQMLGKCEKKYHSYASGRPSPSIGNNFFRVGYDAKADINGIVTKALLCDAAGHKEEARAAYAEAIARIDWAIEGDELRTLPKKRSNFETAMQRDLMQEKAAIAQYKRGDDIKRNPTERAMMEREKLRGPVNEMIDEKIEEGKISNPRIIQINAQLRNMSLRSYTLGLAEKELKMLEIRAMLIGLRDGADAEREYLTAVCENDSVNRKLKRRFKRLLSSLPADASSDRESMVRSLAQYAPLQSGDAAKDKETAEQFYARRKSIADRYPIEWLWKQD